MNLKWCVAILVLILAWWSLSAAAIAKIERFKDDEGTLHISNTKPEEPANQEAAAPPAPTPVKPRVPPAPPQPVPSPMPGPRPNVRPGGSPPPPPGPHMKTPPRPGPHSEKPIQVNPEIPGSVYGGIIGGLLADQMGRAFGPA
jgi:hypothetical protein